MKPDRVRLMRLLIFEGSRDWVENQLSRSITGTKLISSPIHGDCRITVRTIEEFPEIVRQHETAEGDAQHER